MRHLRSIIVSLLLLNVLETNQEQNTSVKRNEDMLPSRLHSETSTCNQDSPAKKKVVCYYRIEEDFRPYEIDACLCTHVVYSNIAVRDNYALVAGKKGDLQFLNLLKTQNSRLKILVSLRINGRKLIDSIIDQNNVRYSNGSGNTVKTTFANRIRDFIITHGIDGVDVDTKYFNEYSGHTNKKETIFLLINALRSSFSQTMNSRKDAKNLLITITASNRPQELTEHYDFSSLRKLVDFVNIPAFDFDNDDTVVKHPARLHGISDMENLDSIVDLILALGLPDEQIIVGVPAFGSVYKLSNSSLTTPGSPAYKRKHQNSTIPYSEICEIRDNSSWKLVREKDLTSPYIYFKDNWIGFDDEISLKLKVKYSLLRNLGGVAVWNVNDDDSVGRCGFGPFPLLQSVNDLLRSSDTKTRNDDSSLLIIEKYGNVERIVENSESDVQLPCTRLGYIQHPKDCSRFYRCVKFNKNDFKVNKFQYGCPSGLVFDDVNEVCNWPSWSSSCPGSGEVLQVPKKQFACPTYGYFQHPQNCEYFYYCSDFGKGIYQGYQFKCPFNLAFDEEKLLCNWKWLVKGCNIDNEESEKVNAQLYTESGIDFEPPVRLSENYDEISSRSDDGHQAFSGLIPAEHRNEEQKRRSFTQFVKEEISSLVDTLENKVKNMFSFRNIEKRQDDGNRFANWFSSFNPFALSPQHATGKLITAEQRPVVYRQRLPTEEPVISIPIIELPHQEQPNLKNYKWKQQLNYGKVPNPPLRVVDEIVYTANSEKEIPFSLMSTNHNTRIKVDSRKPETIPVPILTLRDVKSRKNLYQQIQRRPDNSDVNLYSDINKRRPNQQERPKIGGNNRFQGRVNLRSTGQKQSITPQNTLHFQTPPQLDTSPQIPRNKVIWPHESTKPQTQNRYIVNGDQHDAGSVTQMNKGSHHLHNQPLKHTQNNHENLDIINIDIKSLDHSSGPVEEDASHKEPKIILPRPLPLPVPNRNSQNNYNQFQGRPKQPVKHQPIPHNLPQKQRFHQITTIPRKIPLQQPFVNTNTQYFNPPESHYKINIPDSRPPVTQPHAPYRYTTQRAVTRNGFVPLQKTVLDQRQAGPWKSTGLHTSGSSVEYSVFKDKEHKNSPDHHQKNKMVTEKSVQSVTPMKETPTPPTTNKEVNSKYSKSPKPPLVIIPVPDNHPKAESLDEIMKMKNMYPELFPNTFNFSKIILSDAKSTTKAPKTSSIMKHKDVPQTDFNSFEDTIFETATMDSLRTTAVTKQITLLDTNDSRGTSKNQIQSSESHQQNYVKPPPPQHQSFSLPKQTTVNVETTVTSNLPNDENQLINHQNLSQSLYDSIQQVIAQHLNTQLKTQEPYSTNSPSTRRSSTYVTNPGFTSTEILTTPSTATTVSSSYVTSPITTTAVPISVSYPHGLNYSQIQEWLHQPSWYQYHHQILAPISNGNETLHSVESFPVYHDLHNHYINTHSLATSRGSLVTNRPKLVPNMYNHNLYFSPNDVQPVISAPTSRPFDILRNKAETPQIEVYIVQGANGPQVKTRNTNRESEANVKVFVIDDTKQKLEATDTKTKKDRYHYYSGSEDTTGHESVNVTKEEHNSETESDHENVEYEDAEFEEDKVPLPEKVTTNKAQDMQNVYNTHLKLRNFTDGSVPESACTRPGLFQHPHDCNKFYECFWDKFIHKYTLHLLECPVKLAFDSRIVGCSSASDSTVCVQY